MIFSITNPTELVDWLQIFCKSGWLSPWDPPLQWGKIHEEFTAPQHIRFILPPIHPTKSIAMLHGRYFSFMGNAPWKFHEPTGRDTDFPSTPLHKQGQELRSERTVIPIHEQHNLYLFFCVLTIRKQLPGNDFERSGRGQEPSRGHKFSILENVVLHRDFTSSMHLHFRSDLVGACLPQTLLIIRALRHEWNGVSCFT